ncbi:MAG TPA: STT3 domain-containing protein [Candidatus Nanoarchaeia archaeon]|nr:STT3 domain-containing protein [Candidatus Nanoarchaeia archaeon]
MDESSPQPTIETTLEERKEKIFSFLKKNNVILSLILIAVLVWFAVWIRTTNLSALRDVTTGGWTLGPDLDPFLFLRWAKYIIEHGTLFANDPLRYVPIGFDTREELVFHSYSMAWFHKLAVLFGSDSVEQSAALFPVFMFALTVVFFFLLARLIARSFFDEQNALITASLSCLFLIVIPSLLPRTIAGIPEKEAAGFFYLALSFYFFLASWKSPSKRNQIIFAIISGIGTGLMALVWGGYIFLYYTIALVILISFLLNKISLKDLPKLLAWFVPTILLTSTFFTQRYGWFILSPHCLIIIVVIAAVCIQEFLKKPLFLKYTSYPFLKKIPKHILSLVIATLLGALLAGIFFGMDFISSNVQGIVRALIEPIQDRLGVTVAENRQPYFAEWANSFGPMVKGIPLFFWLFVVGSVYMVWILLPMCTKKERIMTTSAFAFFLSSLIFSRYSPSSIFNGLNVMSKLYYLAGLLSITIVAFYIYYRYERRGDEDKLSHIDMGILLVLCLFMLSIIGARGAVRLIMVLALPTALIVPFFLVSLYTKARAATAESRKLILWIVVFIVVIGTLFALYRFGMETYNTGKQYAPYLYTHQWQQAMAWVRENTPQTAVFGHWWDYGYWLQSIGERATVLDGGNRYPYWNHLMGRHALTSPSEAAALEFLYSHNTTHFLIDSTDIGKYGAFSSIGSDENYDRSSWIPEFQKDQQNIRESKNGTIVSYNGGVSLEADMTYDQNGTKIILLSGKAALAQILVTYDTNNTVQLVQGVYVDCLECAQKGTSYKTHILPFRYFYKDSFTDTKRGVESGVYIFPRLIQGSTGGVAIDPTGSLLYLSNRTVKSQLARLYLYNEHSDYFKLVHSQDNAIMQQLKQQTPFLGDIVSYQGLQGPIKIWEITYPKDIKLNAEYLKLTYPSKALESKR